VVQDETIYGDKGPLGATAVHTLSSQMTEIPKPAWDTMRVGMLCESAGTFADVKTAFEQLCTMVGPECTVEVQQTAMTLFKQVELAHGSPLVPRGTLPLVKALRKAAKLKQARHP
jgi:hypothetical protein